MRLKFSKIFFALLYVEETTLLCLHVTLPSSQCAIIFSQSLIIADFFTSGIGPDILMNVLEDRIIFLIWAAWVLLDYYLKQKQKFSV